MKVLFVNTDDLYGGAARAAWRVMRGVQRQGIEVQFFVKNRFTNSSDVVSIWQFVPKNAIYKAFDWIVSKIKNRWYHYKWHPYKKTQKKIFLSDLRSISCFGAMQKMDYNIVHLHWINERFLDIRELAKIHKPIVWTLHDSWPFTGICHVPYDCNKYEMHCGACPMLGSSKEKDLAYEVCEKKMEAYKNLNLHIVTPSRWLGDCAKKSALFSRFPVHVIPNCIDTDVYKPMDKQEARKQLGLDTNKTYLLFGAMYAKRDTNKGFAFLQESLELLKTVKIELLVYGTDGDIIENDVAIPVHAFGFISKETQMMLLNNSADISIVPSLSENLSNTIMESLSCGTPVVAFNIGGNSDMIEHKKNGYLANEKDCEDLACGIEWCLAHNADGALSMNAREKVLNNYTIDIVSNQYKQLYESL